MNLGKTHNKHGVYHQVLLTASSSKISTLTLAIEAVSASIARVTPESSALTLSVALIARIAIQRITIASAVHVSILLAVTIVTAELTHNLNHKKA